MCLVPESWLEENALSINQSADVEIWCIKIINNTTCSCVEQTAVK